VYASLLFANSTIHFAYSFMQTCSLVPSAIFNAATAAASMATQPFDASRSRSAFEAELANSAAKHSKTEHGVSIKKARNMDNHAQTDSLSNALCSSTKHFTSAIERLAPSPSTKSSKVIRISRRRFFLLLKRSRILGKSTAITNLIRS
jgi:hypothetical protein